MDDSINKHRRRSWDEIVAYYRQTVEFYPSLGWHLMHEFAEAACADVRFGSLVTVGSLGCVMIFRDSECRGADGHIKVCPGPTHEAAKIRMGYLDAARNVLGAATFQEAGPALEHFASLLREHGFLDRPA